jgi:hypothetical protein
VLVLVIVIVIEAAWLLAGPPRARTGIAVAALILASACGYHFHGTQSTLPSDVRTIGIGTIENKSLEHGLEKNLAFAFEREVFVRRHYRLANSPGGADALLAGTIREVSRRPVAYDEDDQAVLYEVLMRFDLSLVRQRDGKILWSVRDMRELDEYASNPNVVETSSVDFQRGTLDVKNLRRDTDLSDTMGSGAGMTEPTPRPMGDGIPDDRQISNIQFADYERKQAMNRLLQRAVRDAYDRMIEGF